MNTYSCRWHYNLMTAGLLVPDGKALQIIPARMSAPAPWPARLQFNWTVAADGRGFSRTRQWF